MSTKKNSSFNDNFDQELDAEEKDMLESFERGKWKRVADFKEEKDFAEEAAVNYFRKIDKHSN